MKRDLIEKMSYKAPFFFDSLRIVANLLTFFFIAKVFGAGASKYLTGYGGEYFPFVLVGIAFAGYQSAALNSLSGALGSEQGNGTLEAILITPTSLSTVMLAGALWSLLFTTVRVAVTLLIGTLILGADLSAVDLGAALLTVLLTITSLSGLAMVSAGFLLVYKKGEPVGMILNGVSRLIAGVYFPVAVLPEWFQGFARFIPLTHSLEALRNIFLNGAGVGELGSEFLALSLFTLFLLPPGIFFLRWSVRKAKDEGSLVFY